MVLERQQYSVFLQFKNFLSNVVTPLHYIAESPIQVGRYVGENFVLQRTLLKENTALKEKQVLLEADLLHLKAIEKENTELQSLKDVTAAKKQSFLIGRILAVDSTVYLAQVIINQGSRQGVFVGQIAVDNKGVLGQVVRVDSDTSRVQLITDTASGVPIQFLANGLRGIAVGEGNRDQLIINYIPITANVEVGDELVTSGLGGRFPAGYPIGKVTGVHHQSGDIFLQIEATPSANVAGANFVLLLLEHEKELKHKRK
jgi:rod shape-determining protein MreC